MYCRYCGTELPDDAAFCPKCGKPVADSEKREDNKFGYGANGSGKKAVLSSDVVRKIGKNPMTLVLTIALSLGIVFSLLGYDFSLMNLLTLLCETVVCVGCWMVYVESVENGDVSLGFSVLRIGVPVYLVISLFGLIVTAFVVVAESYGVFIKLILILAYLVLIMLSVCCYAGLCRTTNDGFKILKEGSGNFRVGSACFVILIILTVLEVIGVFSEMRYYLNVSEMLANLAMTVTSILAIVLLFEIRNTDRS